MQWVRIGGGIAFAVLCILATGCTDGGAEGTASAAPSGEALPSPDVDGMLSLEAALAARRSVRDFDPEPLTAAEIGQLLWAAQGITNAQGGRTAPSAGALYPLELYVATATGLARYLPASHALEPVSARDLRPELARAALGQESVAEAPAVVVVAGVPARAVARYGDRADRFVQLEAGHAAQNLLLQAVALGLGAVPIGAFDDAAIADLLDLPGGVQPIYLLPVGHPAG